MRPGSIVFGIAVGLLVAWWSYEWITDPAKRTQRTQQEQAVTATRSHLAEKIGNASLEIVDPLAPQRKVGKVYVYPAGPGWEVSGFYRRGEADEWHAFLASLDADLSLALLKVQDDDPALASRAEADATLAVLP